IILLPLMGVVGAVISTLISYGVGIIISILIGRKLFKMTVPIRQVSKIIMSNLLLLIFLVILPEIDNNFLYLFITGLVSIVFYVLLMFIFNIINTREIILKKLKRRRV